MGGKIQFSEKALASRNSVGKSHALTSVKARWTWFLLGSVTLLFSALVVWGFYGSMVETVSGTGVTILSRGVHPIVARGDGTLTTLNIHPGARVSAGQSVGQLHNAQMFFNIRKLENEYSLLTSEVNFLKDGIARLTARKVELDKNRSELLSGLSDKQTESHKRADEVAQRYSTLMEQGAASRVNLYQVMDSALQTENALLSTRMQMMEAELSQEDNLWQQEQRLLELNQQLEQKRRDLDLAQRLYRDSCWITVEFDGVVQEVFKEEGSHVQQGERVGLVASDLSNGMYLVAYVPATEQAQIRNGMSAYFAPSVASPSRYGYIKCVVRETSSAPINPEAVQTELANATLVQMLANQGPMLRVVLEMLPDSASPSGYCWTSRQGYDGKIVNGMLGQVLINTEHRAPASYVIPALRELLKRNSTESSKKKDKEKKD